MTKSFRTIQSFHKPRSFTITVGRDAVKDIVAKTRNDEINKKGKPKKTQAAPKAVQQQ